MKYEVDMHLIHQQKKRVHAASLSFSHLDLRSIVLLCGLLLAATLFFTACEINPKAPDRYALVYGVSDYSNYDSGINLSFTDDDGVEVGELLAEKGFKVYLRVNDGSGSYPFAEDVKKASTDQLEQDIAMIRSILEKDDIFLFFFSGHGTYDNSTSSDDEGNLSEPENEYVLLYPTASKNSLEDILLCDNALGTEISTFKSKKNVILLDACNSGGFINNQNDVDRMNPAYSDDSEYRSDVFSLTLDTYFNSSSADIPPSDAIVITAAGELELSWEGGYFSNHGALSYGILKSAKKGDENNDGYIDTGEIYRYTRDFVETNWNASWKYIQQQTGRSKEEIQFIPRISGGAVDYILFEAD